MHYTDSNTSIAGACLPWKEQEALAVHDILHCTGKKPLQVCNSNIHQSLTAFFWCPTDMWCDQAILRLQERIVLLDRLRGDNIQSCGSYLATIEGFGKILFYNQGTSTVIDQDNPIFHLGDAFLVDDTLGFRKKEDNAMQSHHFQTTRYPGRHNHLSAQDFDRNHRQ